MIRDLEDKGYDPAGIRRLPERDEVPPAPAAEADVKPIRVRPGELSRRKPDPDDKPEEAKPE